MRTLFLIIILSPFIRINGQNNTQELSYNQFIEIVKEHHPVAKQAQLYIDKGDAALLKAKGNFDPKFDASIRQKYFQETQYFSLISGNISIPTPIGIDVKGGYDVTDGTYLNPENLNPNSGLLYAGVSVPLGQGLFIDLRRTELKKARLIEDAAQFQRQKLLNQLMLEAGESYWNWFKCYQEQAILKEAVLIAQQRFNAVKNSANIGENPFIDTVEAKIQVQNREISFAEAQVKYNNARLLLSIYLWSEEDVPLELKESTIPSMIDLSQLKQINKDVYDKIDSINLIHPDIQLYKNKISSLEVEQKWYKEQLKPKVNLNYLPLSEGFGGASNPNLSFNNYKWGLDVSFPLFLRKQRGQVKLANLKILEAQYDLRFRQLGINAKVQANLNEWKNNIILLNKSQEVLENSAKLLEAEKTLFSNGESSLFLINSREINYIKAQQTRIKYFTKNRVSELKTRYSLGSLTQ